MKRLQIEHLGQRRKLTQATSREPIIRAYVEAKEMVIREGFGYEIEWQNARRLSLMSESEFLKEAAWVILSSGMRETIVRRVFGGISAAFLDWKSAASVAHNRKACEARAVRLFHHPAKIAAIASVCERVSKVGFATTLRAIQTGGLGFLRTFDFIGPVTGFHLAKNIGLDVAKPDRHLTRIARAVNLGNPQELCRIISVATGDRISVVDLVLWRYATLNPRYLLAFRHCSSAGPISRAARATR